MNNNGYLGVLSKAANKASDSANKIKDKILPELQTSINKIGEAWAKLRQITEEAKHHEVK